MKTATITTWNPFRDFDVLSNRLFGTQPVTCSGPACDTAPARAYSPSVDVTETESEYKIVADVPEADKEGFKVTVENNVLTLRGERKTETSTENARVVIRERSYGSFSRSFRLPEDADGSAVTAAYKEGLLTVTVPKKADLKPKSITVAVS